MRTEVGVILSEVAALATESKDLHFGMKPHSRRNAPHL
jgi:hypothetical protein